MHVSFRGINGVGDGVGGWIGSENVTGVSIEETTWRLAICRVGSSPGATGRHVDRSSGARSVWRGSDQERPWLGLGG